MLQTALILSFCALLAWVGRKYFRRLPLPPKPAFQKDSHDQPWTFYAKCSRSLGPLISLSSFGSVVIVINTTKAVTDLLEKRSTFSCKPRWPMAELLGRQKNVGFQYYGERLKKSRKVIHTSMNANAVLPNWGRLMDTQSVQLVQQFFSSPESFYDDVQNNTQEVIVRLAYGRKPDAEYLLLAKEVKHQTSAALQPGRWMVNFIPALALVPAWAPGAGFQRWARDAKESFFKMTRVPFHEVKHDLENGRARPSFVQKALEDLPAGSQNISEELDIIMSTAGSLFSAGTETLEGSILTFIALMFRHPEVRARAYEEIVSVVGKDRLPGLDDREALRYIDCVIQEVHRFNPAIPLVTHSNTTEDEYLGYRIPKKTWLMANVWAMLHDDEVYPEPEKFIPERFIPSDGHSVPRDPRTLVYGFGRRVCPGLHFANTYLYLVVARTLALFDLSPEVKNGILVLPPLEFRTALVPAPKPFRCRMEPRVYAEELLAHAQS